MNSATAGSATSATRLESPVIQASNAEVAAAEDGNAGATALVGGDVVSASAPGGTVSISLAVVSTIGCVVVAVVDGTDAVVTPGWLVLAGSSPQAAVVTTRARTTTAPMRARMETLLSIT
jgi:hypothetical protein